MKKIIVVSAHPDDETLGVGGTLLRHKKEGDDLYWLIVTNISEAQGFLADRVAARQKEIETVSKMFGFTKVFKLDYPTMQLSSDDLIDMVPKVSSIFLEVQPEVLYVLNRSDAHSDHRIVFDAVAACTKSFRYPFIKQVLMYECLSETEFAPALPEKAFIPNYYVDVSKFINKKISIMKLFESELGKHPFPRSIENIRAIAQYRGAIAGVKYAEAFQLIKYINK